MMSLYTTVLLPLFNKLTPLDEGNLKDKIIKYAQGVHFPLERIMVMDGSKRSSKANAFFSGIGKRKSIVLYDTLINELNEEQVVAVLAHEVGHYKRKHILYGIVMSVMSLAIFFFCFNLISNSDSLAAALHCPPSFHVSLLVFGILFQPISEVLGIFQSILSRKHEFEADDYAKNTSSAASLIKSLTKLNTNHLGNPRPHWLNVFLNYSHPPILQRIKNLNS